MPPIVISPSSAVWICRWLVEFFAPNKQIQAAFGDVNILSGIHVVCDDVILSKWRAANTNAAMDSNVANNVTIVEFTRINVKQCSRNFCLGTLRNSIRIKPNIPDRTSWNLNLITVCFFSFIKCVKHTAKPLQYGLSLSRVLGAQHKIQTPRNAIDIPHTSWNISNTLANNGNLISNGFGRRGARKKIGTKNYY